MPVFVFMMVRGERELMPCTFSYSRLCVIRKNIGINQTLCSVRLAQSMGSTTETSRECERA